MTITYLKGDATRFNRHVGEKYLIHVCNNRGGWGSGFVLELSRHWAQPEDSYREWFKAKNHLFWGSFELGAIQIINVAPQLSVVNMIAQEGYKTKSTPPDAKPPIRYDALGECLKKVAISAKPLGASIHGPRFGAGLAGGRWAEIEPLINAAFQPPFAAPVYIYDL
jgi:O-acetyl-ADP-ribose deacetylase (regulator of RNase III)